MLGPIIRKIPWDVVVEYALEALALEAGAVIGARLGAWLVPKPPKRKHRRRSKRRRERG